MTEEGFKQLSEEEVMDAARTIRSRLMTEDPDGNHTLIVSRAKELKAKYPNYDMYKMYHVLSGSTFPEYCTEFDFLEEDSVEKFLKSL